tara:strand:+ start:108 stop:317 length:210 start_codon:yes stop_codon:yes gene_type:complete
MSKSKLNEGMFDTIVKGIVGVFFGQKLINQAAKKAAMKDPKVKAHVKKIRQDIEEFDRLMDEFNKKYGG